VTTLAGVLVATLLVGAVLFTVVAAVGLFRLPDLYSRAHAASKSETMGATLALAAVAVAIGPDVALVKVVLLLAAVFVTGPTAAHAIARAAYEEGQPPWVHPDRESADGTPVVADGGAPLGDATDRGPEPASDTAGTDAESATDTEEDRR
jgi:multicomponent Na+:H+ antiporter subunit G